MSANGKARLVESQVKGQRVNKVRLRGESLSAPRDLFCSGTGTSVHRPLSDTPTDTAPYTPGPENAANKYSQQANAANYSL